MPCDPSLNREECLEEDNTVSDPPTRPEQRRQPTATDSSTASRVDVVLSQHGSKLRSISSGQSSHSALEDMVRGMIFASLAITDDHNGTLAKVGKTNPWQIEALKLIVDGNEDEAHKPLSYLLQQLSTTEAEESGLQLDCHIDVQGVSPGGHFLDTQGYIAHNDQLIVLSYRCTTTGFDWLTNLNTTSSAWEIEEDVAQGFSGFCSDLEGLCCVDERKPRVHTGFYNNFLATVPLIQKHVQPLLGPHQPPRKLFVTGHSLGAGIATLAAAYMLFEYEWDSIPQSLHHVSAGSPRACGRVMSELLQERIHKFSDSVHVYRLVKGKDVVASVPPAALGFRHISNPVTIDKDGKITLTKEGSIVHDEEVEQREDAMEQLAHTVLPDMDDDTVSTSQEEVSPDNVKRKQSKYDKLVSKIPASLRDHMPDFYLRPLLRAKSGHVVQAKQLDNIVKDRKSSDARNDGDASTADRTTSFGWGRVSMTIIPVEGVET